MIKTVISLLFLSTAPTRLSALEYQALTAPDINDETFRQQYCTINIPEKPEKTITLPFPLSFFISPNPNGKEVAVIDEGFANKLIDLSSLSDQEVLSDGSKQISILPGSVDPVFTPDGKYITLPSSIFYRYEDAKKKADKAKPVVQEFHGAPYQSVGQPNPKRRDYNYISDPNPIDPESNIYFTKVLIEDKKVLGIFKREVQTISKGHVCKGKITGSLPMISPDGKYISYLDKFTQTTKIMFIGVNGDECKEVLDLGIPTGKVSFNFDENNRQLTFHVERSNYISGWFQEITATFSTDAFILDIDSSTNEETGDEKWKVSGMKRLSMNSTPRTGTYYPRFTRDGGVIAAKTTVDKDGDVVSNIVQFSGTQIDRLQSNTTAIINPSLVKGQADCQKSPVLDRQIALGKLFSSVCDTLSLPDQDKDSLLIAPFIDRDSCFHLITDFWNSRWAKIKMKTSSRKEEDLSYLDNITKDDLLAICPEETGRSTEVKIEAEKINDKQVTDAELFQDKCAACHESGFNEVKGGLAFFHAGDNGGLVENTRNTGSYAGLNSYTAEMSILSLISRPEDVRNVMPPEETHITKEEKIRIARYLMKYIDENQVGPDLKRELQAQIDAYSIRQ